MTSAWQLMQEFVPCAEAANVILSTNSEIDLPAELVIASVLSPWQSRQPESFKAAAFNLTTVTKTKLKIMKLLRRIIKLSLELREAALRRLLIPLRFLIRQRWLRYEWCRPNRETDRYSAGISILCLRSYKCEIVWSYKRKNL